MSLAGGFGALGGAPGAVEASGGTAQPGKGWWAYRSDSGAFGIRQGRPGIHQSHNIYLGQADTLVQLAQDMAERAHETGHPWSINDALIRLGMPASWLAALITQLDAGAILRNPSYIEFSGKGSRPTVHSDKSTKVGSEAVPTNVLPSPIPPDVGNSHLGGLGSIFGFLGSLQFWKGIGLVLGGVLILIFAALELRGR